MSLKILFTLISWKVRVAKAHLFPMDIDDDHWKNQSIRKCLWRWWWLRHLLLF